jgi:hypothetical protein
MAVICTDVIHTCKSFMECWKHNPLETVLYPAAVCWKFISEIEGVRVKAIFWELCAERKVGNASVGSSEQWVSL